jgi:hypothetical protein
VTRTTFVMGLILAVAGSAAAQGGGGRAAAGKSRPRDEVIKMIDAYIVSNLQESVGLTDDQFVKVLPLLKKLQSDRRSYAERRRERLQEMRRLFESGRASEQRIAELMKDVLVLENEQPEILRKDVEALDAVLTTVQKAKLRLLEIQVEQNIRELMNRVRQQQRPGAGHRTLPAEPVPE